MNFDFLLHLGFTQEKAFGLLKSISPNAELRAPLMMRGVARLMIEGVAAGDRGVSVSRPQIMNPAPCRSVLHLGDLLTLLTLKLGTMHTNSLFTFQLFVYKNLF